MVFAFKSGFEKTAVLGLSTIGKGIVSLGKKTMPKIFKWTTQSKGKFSPMKALGTGFAGLEGADVLAKTRGQTKRPVQTFKNYIY